MYNKVVQLRLSSDEIARISSSLDRPGYRGDNPELISLRQRFDRLYLDVRDARESHQVLLGKAIMRFEGRENAA